MMLFNLTEKKLEKWAAKHEAEKLIQALNNKEKSLRNKAFSLLHEMFGEELTKKLLSFLDANSRELRVGAVKGLEKVKNLSVGSELLNKYAHLDKGIQPYATHLFGKMKTTEALPILLEQLQDNNSLLQEASMEALIQLDKSATDALISFYHETKEPETKEAIVFILSQTADPKSLDILTQCIHSHRKELVELGIEGYMNLGALAEKTTLKLLQDEKTIIQACEILVGIGTPEHINELLLVARGENKKAAAIAILALGYIGDPAVIDDLKQIIQDPGNQDTKLRKEEDKEEKEIRIEDNKTKRTLRNNCIIALGHLRSPKTHSILLQGLDDPHTHEAAAQAILQNGKELTIKALEHDSAFAKEALFLSKKNSHLEAQIKLWIEEWKNGDK